MSLDMDYGSYYIGAGLRKLYYIFIYEAHHDTAAEVHAGQ